ncbi:MAG TPA: glycosyltransferase family A protein, partial [Cyclobacteriaceae bacterium]|nr:glycosyltransferase family A protein [Cyclobacteriaceae bacterium]
MDYPLVSVICLCYNHEEFVEEAIESVLAQTYPNVELIVVDDASVDRSKQVIGTILKQHERVKFIDLKENHGNCAAFNIGFRQCQGKYVVDFATDDIMLNSRIAEQVQF